MDLKYLPEWKDPLKELVADRVSNLKGHFKSPKCKVLDQPDVKDTLSTLYANYVLVSADKAANKAIIVCKKYYIDPGVMHEVDDAYSIRSTWSCYWLDQFLTLALDILILSIFYISMDLSTNYFAHFSGC